MLVFWGLQQTVGHHQITELPRRAAAQIPSRKQAGFSFRLAGLRVGGFKFEARLFASLCAEIVGGLDSTLVQLIDLRESEKRPRRKSLQDAARSFQPTRGVHA